VVSLFLVLQLAVYAGLQVPVGVLLDRLGSRRMILAGALTMAAGQLLLALATDVPTAVAARVLVGAGDAMTFISVLRVISFWFPGHTVPLITQLTGIFGQLGSIAAATPWWRCCTARPGKRPSWVPRVRAYWSPSWCSSASGTPRPEQRCRRPAAWATCGGAWP